MVESSASAAATTSATSARETVPFSLPGPSDDAAGRRLQGEPARSQHRPVQIAGAQVGVGGGLGLRVGEERIILRHTMIRSRAEVGHHHEPLDARLRGGVDHPDRGVAVDGVGPRRIAAARPAEKTTASCPASRSASAIGVELLDVGHHAAWRR